MRKNEQPSARGERASNEAHEAPLPWPIKRIFSGSPPKTCALIYYFF